MTDTAHKTLPQNIKDVRCAAIAKIAAWNAAVSGAPRQASCWRTGRAASNTN